MDVDRWSALQEAFDQLVEMDPEDQSRALQGLYDKDPALATDVRELLEEDASAGASPEINVKDLLKNSERRDDVVMPAQGEIGPYRVLKLLGEGGMGVVYLAERTDIGGYVAIKMLRDAWLSPMRRERFSVEQQTLGLLNHPSIARIYDAGTTTDGTPWFVMEFVDGVPITEYRRGRSTSIQEIMEMVRTICEAVRHAHSLAIIHRDLKPSNILVTSDGAVKLLDFGIAKQMEVVNLGETSTTSGFSLFTPAYAAPELRNERKVGVFTDVYSMGVILYELVTGTLPGSEDPSSGPGVQKPSKCHSAAASNLGLRLSNREWADVDAVCIKALSKDVEGRYRSMDASIEDITAFVENRPLHARKNVFFYTAGKFLRRNWLPVTSATLALVIVLTGTVLFTVRLARARNIAAHARDEAVKQAARSERIQHFTESLFTGGANIGYPPPDIKISQMLDRGKAEALDITGDAQLQAAMFQSVGTAYVGLSDFSDAEPLLKSAKRMVCTTTLSNQCADIEVQLAQAVAEHDSIDEAVALLRDAERIKEATLPLNDLSLSDACVELAWHLYFQGNVTEAKKFATQGLSVASADGRPSREFAFALATLGQIGFDYNDPRTLEYVERGSHMDQQLFGPNSFEFARSEAAIGWVFTNYGRYPEAEKHFRLALAGAEAWSGENQEITERYMMRLAFLLSQEGKYPEARELLVKALAIDARHGSPSSLKLSQAYFNLGFIELELGDLNSAMSRFQSVISISNQHPAVAEQDLELSELGVATIETSRGDYAQAESLIRQVLSKTKLMRSYIGVAGPALLGHVLLLEGKPTEAEVELRKAYLWFSHDSTMRPHTAQTYKDLAEAERQLGRPQESVKLLAELRAHPK